MGVLTASVTLMLASPGVTVHPAIRKPPRGSRPHATTTEAVPQYAPTIPASTTAPASPTITPPLSFVPSQQSLLPVCQGIDQPRRPARIGPSLGCRIVAAYGNPLSKGMGILGRLPPDAMLADITKRTAEWQNADPARTHRCALELIAISVQASPGPAGLYRAQMGPKLIDQVLQWARNTNCLLILDMQVGHSTVEAELPYLSPWLAQPDVALGLDPEWDMPPGVKPGTRIGTMDANDINTAIATLSRLVDENHLPPKLLVVHRFLDHMVTHPENIHVPDQIRLVVNMDGFGTQAKKLSSYKIALRAMPTPLTGFKLFTLIDQPMLTPHEVLALALDPVPVFINYQ